ncbi:MAG TPA: type II toxin-antitoxin system prevent-host-death family antitoxin [Chthoniobacterales bacterium]|jgi:antitoxin (DNA-binding transcriptional repressor) of toxin-antitoxin stability system
MLSSISQTKNNLSALLEKVQAGETLIILDRNRPVARVERVAIGEDLTHLTPPREAKAITAVLDLPIGGTPGVPGGAVDALLDERSGSR